MTILREAKSSLRRLLTQTSQTGNVAIVILNRRDVLKVLAGVPAASAFAGIAGLPSQAATRSCPPTAYVDVTVATFWVDPDTDRRVDFPSTTNPAHPLAWMDAMTLAERRDLIGDLETQASYGHPVRVLETAGDWSYVAVVGQPTPRNELGYPGWVPTVQLRSNDEFGRLRKRRPFAMVTENLAPLFADRGLNQQVLELSFNTRLPVLNTTGDAVHVAVPSGEARWFRRDDVTIYGDASAIPYPTEDDLVETAMRFIGVRYLWAGVSAYGFDCSGFTSTVYSANGITIPRDAAPQHDAGAKVDRKDLRNGDLIFFARDNGRGRIHHVGMYANGDIIDAPSNSDTEESPLERVELKNHRYIKEYAGAVRYL